MSDTLSGNEPGLVSGDQDSVALGFTQIPGTIAVPGTYTEIQDVPAQNTLAGMPLRVVIVGQQSGGAAVVNTIARNVTGGSAGLQYGAGSSMAQAIAAFSNEMPLTAVDAVGVAPASGAATASGKFAFTGPATASGNGAVFIAGLRVAFSIGAGATAAQAAQSLLQACAAASLSAQTGCTVAIGSDNVSVVITSGEAMLLANDIQLCVSSAYYDQVPGITIAATALSGGAGAPSIAPAIAALGNTWYTDMVLLLNDPANIALAVAEAQRRCGAMVAQDMRIWVSVVGTQGQILTLQGQFQTVEQLVLIPVQAPKWSSFVAAAVAAAQGSQSLNLDPARQLRGVTLNGLAGLAPESAYQFALTQRSVLLTNGCATLSFRVDGSVAFERVVTTRTIDPRSQQASGIWDVMKPAIGARVRFEWDAYVNVTYPNAKLADDGSPLAGLAGVVTCRTLKASWIAQCKLYEGRGWIDDVATTGPQSSFSRDVNDRSRVNAYLPIMPMGSLMVLADILQLQV